MPMSDHASELITDLRGQFGADAVSDDTAAFTIAGRAPACVVRPSQVEQVGELLGLATKRDWAVIPVGNATHLHVGAPPAQYDIALSLQRLARIVAHEAADMTVTVEAGVTLGALNTALAQARQWLPLDPPLAEQVTIGGLIAADLNGPLRLSQGKVRDLLIGITVVLADGSIAKAGGRVVKNVAGYDLGKLFAGSFGTLGVIVEATFKIRPRPEQTRVLWITTYDDQDAAELALTLLDAKLAPLFVEVLNTTAAAACGQTSGGIAIALGGIAEELDAQQAVIVDYCGQSARVCDDHEATQVTHWLREFPRQAPATLTARVSLLPTELAGLLPRLTPEAAKRGLEAAVVAHAGNGVARLHLRGEETQAALFIEWLRIAVRARGGWVVFDSLPVGLHGQVEPFGYRTAALSLMEGIKRQLDPRGTLSPGRFVGGI